MRFCYRAISQQRHTEGRRRLVQSWHFARLSVAKTAQRVLLCTHVMDLYMSSYSKKYHIPTSLDAPNKQAEEWAPNQVHASLNIACAVRFKNSHNEVCQSLSHFALFGYRPAPRQVTIRYVF